MTTREGWQKGFEPWRQRDSRQEGSQSPRSSKGGQRHFRYVSRGQAEQALRKFEAVMQRLQQRHSAGNNGVSGRRSAQSHLDRVSYWG